MIILSSDYMTSETYLYFEDGTKGLTRKTAVTSFTQSSRELTVERLVIEARQSNFQY